jgi:hypothetical protein
MRGKATAMDTRAEAVGLAMVKGVPAASKATGIPQRTLRRWKDDPQLAELGLSAREEVKDRLWVAIQVGLDEVYGGMTDPGEPLKAKAEALFGLMDKYALWSGEATSRNESRDITKEFDDHELALLRDAIQREDSTQHPEEAAVAGDRPTGADPA